MLPYHLALLRNLARNWTKDHADNHDHTNCGAEPPAVTPREALRRYTEQAARGAFLYGLLADQPSRKLLLDLMAFRVLGQRKVKLPRNTPKYWQDIASMSGLRTDAAPIPIKFMNARLGVFNLRPLGYELSCHATPTGLAYTVVQKQYEYHRGEAHCKAEAGDVVIDAGACWGETTMHFAHEAKTVVAFEFIPSNLEVTRRNIGLNPHLASRVHVVEQPLWDVSGRKLYYLDHGPASRVGDEAEGRGDWDGSADTATIDEVAARLDLPRIDFIKMDIEGAELPALRGAETSIRKWRPKLAISLYHRPDDFDAIPRYLAGLGLDYRFYLDHHTIFQNETVLFAVPPKRG